MNGSIWRRLLHIAATALAVAVYWTFGARIAWSEEPSQRQYWADVQAYSLVPGDEIFTYHSHSGGGVGPNGGLGLGIRAGDRSFDVSLTVELKVDADETSTGTVQAPGQDAAASARLRFLVKLEVIPDADDQETRRMSKDYDLSDLKPRVIELRDDEDAGGRVYRLVLLPRVIVAPQAKQFDVRARRLYDWSFPSSPVILDDQHYIGRLSMSRGSVASCDIAGVANVEFSLLQLKDAKPLGKLKDGVIDIVHSDGTAIQISDVKNGVDQEVLAGGPYQVWVRWSEPSQTRAEYREMVKQQIEELKKNAEHGAWTLPPTSLKKLEAISTSERTGITQHSLRSAEPDEIVQPAGD